MPTLRSSLWATIVSSFILLHSSISRLSLWTISQFLLCTVSVCRLGVYSISRLNHYRLRYTEFACLTASATSYTSVAENTLSHKFRDCVTRTRLFRRSVRPTAKIIRELFGNIRYTSYFRKFQRNFGPLRRETQKESMYVHTAAITE
jgi:hypothetical protein